MADAEAELRPPTPGELKRLLRREGLRPRRGLSQNFLTDAEALDTIVAAAELGPGDRVVEIGPGLGVLTRRLLAAGCTVVAVEIDPHLVGFLSRELDDAAGLTLIEADALEVDPGELFPGEPYRLVANIPYHITSPLIHRFLGGAHPPDTAVLLVQVEVAERIASPPGDMSYLSVFVQDLAEAQIVARVPAAAFEPAPEVDSAVLRLVRRPDPHRPDRPAGDIPPDCPGGVPTAAQADSQLARSGAASGPCDRGSRPVGLRGHAGPPAADAVHPRMGLPGRCARPGTGTERGAARCLTGCGGGWMPRPS